jgi:hypothetical protein
MKKLFIILLLMSCKKIIVKQTSIKTQLTDTYNVKKRSESDNKYQNNFFNSLQHKKIKN